MDFQLLILDEVRAGVYVVPSSKNIMVLYNKYNI